MTLEPTIPLGRRQGEVERHSITSCISLLSCPLIVVVNGTGIYTVRQCVYVDAHKVKFTKVHRFQQVNATFEKVCGAGGGRKG